MCEDSKYSLKWEAVRNSDDIFRVWRFLEEHSGLPYDIREKADEVMEELKRREIGRMEENPSVYPRHRLMCLVYNNVISLRELIDKGLLTQEAYERVQNSDDYVRDNPINVTCAPANLTDQYDITDVYLFGIPAAGKSSVLMGLLGSGAYFWNNAIAAGEYGDILSNYLDNRQLLPITLDKLYCIHGHAKDKNGNKHLINLIDVPGSYFLDKIVNNPDLVEHLKNNHRKIFFIVIDPTVKMIMYEKKIKKRDDNGNIIYDIKAMAVAQKAVIKRMMNILAEETNKEIMKKVDALHFIATKSDVIDHAKKDIRECVTDYQESFKVALELCKPKVANINEATGYKPKLYTFSLGKFYVGGAFEYDSTDSDKLMNVIIENTLAIRDYSSFETIVDKILNYKVFRISYHGDKIRLFEK